MIFQPKLMLMGYYKLKSLLQSIGVMEGFNIRVDLGLIQVYLRFAEVKQRKEGILGRMNCFRELQVTLRRD